MHTDLVRHEAVWARGLHRLLLMPTLYSFIGVWLAVDKVGVVRLPHGNERSLPGGRFDVRGGGRRIACLRKKQSRLGRAAA